MKNWSRKLSLSFTISPAQYLIFSSLLPVSRFEQCKIPLGVTAWDIFGFRTKVINGKFTCAIQIYTHIVYSQIIVQLAHLSDCICAISLIHDSSFLEGSLAAGIRASCCVPLLFAPVVINGRSYFDGGFFDEAGIPTSIIHVSQCDLSHSIVFIRSLFINSLFVIC
jgi:predicted acylesterase/phospholipase RssA